MCQIVYKNCIISLSHLLCKWNIITPILQMEKWGLRHLTLLSRNPQLTNHTQSHSSREQSSSTGISKCGWYSHPNIHCLSPRDLGPFHWNRRPQATASLTCALSVVLQETQHPRIPQSQCPFHSDLHSLSGFMPSLSGAPTSALRPWPRYSQRPDC